MAAGRIVDGVDMLASQNRIHSIEHRQERLEAIGRAYAATPDGTLVVSPDNRSRKELNAAIRDHLLIEGEVQYREYDRTVETAEGPVKVQWPKTEIVVYSITRLDRTTKEHETGEAA